jgi:dipeptidyl aminopeptidase/acylaminoacyl peptidase
VTYAGVFDFVARFTDERHIALQPNVKTKIKSNGEWVGPAFSANNSDWIQASAINHIDANDPPMLFLQCKDDSTVPWRQSQEMYERVKKAGVETSLTYYETGGHGFQNLGDKPMEDMLQFFREKL